MTAPTIDWQATIRELFTIGRDTDYPGLGSTDGAGLTPFVGAAALSSIGPDVVFGGDRLGVRRIRIRVKVLGDTEADAWQNWRALASAWRPQPDRTEVPLDVRWPGMAETVMRAYGHPAGATVNPATLKAGYLSADLAFDADPLWYGDDVTQASAASPVTLPSSGETGADTNRATITVHGSGGTPSIVLDSTGEDITFNQVLAAGQTYVIDLHERTVTKAGNDASTHVASSSTWFRIPGGEASTLTLTGGAALTVVHRPAHWSP